MRPFVDPASLSPEERRRELAVLLAVGLRRLRTTPFACEKPEESTPNGLESPRDSRLSVHTG